MLFGSTLSQEYIKIANLFNYNIDDILIIVLNSVDAAFVDEGMKHILRKKIIDYFKQNN